jgi:hypothetical protein
MMFIATLYLQQVLGFSALQTGLAFVSLASSACAGGLMALRIIALAASRRTAAVSMVITAAAFVLLSRTPEENGYLPVFLVAGFTFAAAFVPLTAQGRTCGSGSSPAPTEPVRPGKRTTRSRAA